MDKKQSLVLVFLTAAISGFSIYMNKFAVKGIDSDIFTFSKNIIVAVFLFSLIFLITGISEFKKLSSKDWFNLSFIGLIGGSIPFLLYFKGLQMTSAASASIIHKSMFLGVIVLAFIFLKERLNWKILAAAATLLVGNYLLINPALSFNTGDLLILAATIFWAVENTYSKYVLKSMSGNVVGFGRMFFGSAFIMAYLYFSGKMQVFSTLTSSQVTWIFISAGMLSLYVLTWYNGLKNTDVSVATSILLLGSPITTLLNLGSSTAISLFQIAGNIMLVLGVLAFMQATNNLDAAKLRRIWETKTKA